MMNIRKLDKTGKTEIIGEIENIRIIMSKMKIGKIWKRRLIGKIRGENNYRREKRILEN